MAVRYPQQHLVHVHLRQGMLSAAVSNSFLLWPAAPAGCQRTLMRLLSLHTRGLASMCFFRSRSRYSNTKYRRRSAWMTSMSLRGRGLVGSAAA